MRTENACKRAESRRLSNLQHGRTISTDAGTFRKSLGYINAFVIVCNAEGKIDCEI